MSKTIVIGDIHGRDTWKQIVEANQDADKIIFVGDYFDSFNIPQLQQIENFAEILALKEKLGDKVVLLIGNHDFHYMYRGETYSGFNPEHADIIHTILVRAHQEGFIQMAYLQDDLLFTHAGVTKTWCENAKVPINENIDYEINTIFKLFPERFKFTPSNPMDNYGDSITQPPIWVRPEALGRDRVEWFTQVVGHTNMKEIVMTDAGVFIDSLGSGYYLEIKDGYICPKNIKQKIVEKE